MVPQQDRAEATRRRIVSAGVALFGDAGYGMVDMVDVIAQAGVSKGACYYHFPTKQSLAAAIIDESNARIAAAMAPIWESVAPALHRLIRATFGFLELVQTDDTARIGYHLRQSLRPNRDPGSRHFGDTEVVFGGALKQAVRDGHVKADTNLTQTAYTLFTALVGGHLLSEQFGDDPLIRFAEVWEVVLRGIAADDQLPALLQVVGSASRTPPP